MKRLARQSLLFLAVVGVLSGSVQAQGVPTLDRRVSKLEGELRAVQRKVFPDGRSRYFQPEVEPTPPPAVGVVPATPGDPQKTALTELQRRMDGLERQLGEVTGQIERQQLAHQQLEQQFVKLKADAEYRLTTLEGGAAQPAVPAPSVSPTLPAAPPITPPAPVVPPTPIAPPAPPVVPTAKSEYEAAYRYVVDKDYPRAQAALSNFLQKYPGNDLSSGAYYWLGRSYMAQNNPRQAAKAFLDGYTNQSKGPRAPESLMWLGEAMIEMAQPEEACRVYNELDAAYPGKISADMKIRVAQGRKRAKCAG